jgi:uncharacterized membrane protein YdjX (TVP38/TMEM64 family)
MSVSPFTLPELRITMYNKARSRILHPSLRQFTMLTLLTAMFVPLVASPAVAADAGGGLALLGWLQQQLVQTLNWIDGLGAIAPVVFILLYIVITVAFWPASIVTLGAGVVFGVVKGSLLVFVGAMLGAMAAFLVGRYVARDWVARKIAGNPKFQAVDEAIGREGRKIIFLLRLSPIFPFNLLNYALGLSRISLKDYAIGTTGILPGTIMYVYLGHLVGDLATLGTGDEMQNPQAAMVRWVVNIVGLLATIAVTVYITRLAQRALNESLPASSKPMADTPH